MESIYHIRHSGNSYDNNHWNYIDYYLCNSEDEYQQKLSEYRCKQEEIKKRYLENPNNFSNKWCYHNFFFQEEGKIYANIYYYAHEWCGKEFDAYGFGWHETLEASRHSYYFLKPGSLKNINEISVTEHFNIYGS